MPRRTERELSRAAPCEGTGCFPGRDALRGGPPVARRERRRAARSVLDDSLPGNLARVAEGVRAGVRTGARLATRGSLVPVPVARQMLLQDAARDIGQLTDIEQVTAPRGPPRTPV